MHIGNVLTLQQSLGSCGNCCGRDDATAAVDDAIIAAIAAHDIVWAVEDLRRLPCPGGTLAFLGMQEDRPGFCIGLRVWKWPVGEDEIDIAGGDIPEAMTAGHPVAVRDFPLGR